MDTLTLDAAIELLGISDLDSIATSDLPVLERAARTRWHPDKVAHKENSEDTARYTRQFQQIDGAVELVRDYLNGSFHAGARTSGRAAAEDGSSEPEEIVRRNAHDVQSRLRSIWEKVKAARYKWSQESVDVTKGFSLRDLIAQDWNDDIAALSMISLAYGFFTFGAACAFLAGAVPPLGALASVFVGLDMLACVLGVLPLSRFWLPEDLQKPMLWFVNLGLGIYNWADRETRGSDKLWLLFIVHLPIMLASVLKYAVIWPCYEIAKLIVGERIVGAVRKNVDYYGGFATWYVDELLAKAPADMSRDELLDLGRLYSAIGDFRA